MLLPALTDRYWTRALFITLACLSAVAGLVALSVSYVAVVVLLVAAIASAVLAIGADASAGAYRVVVTITHLCGRLIRGAAQLAAFGLVTVAGRAGTSFVVDGSSRDTMWTSKSSLAADTFGGSYVGRRGRRGGWVHDYVAWARTSRNGWAVALLPFLLVLRTTQEHTTDQGVRGDIYTLY